MKKLGLLIMPLMTVSLLASCGGKTPDPQAVQHFVTFDSNGGSHIDTQRVDDGGTASEPSPAPTKTDYTFGGWFITPDFAGGGYDFSTPVTKDITLYADWNGGPIVQHTVTFVLNGATSSPIEPVKVEDGNPYPSEKIPTDPTNPGHAFEGWSKDEKSKDIVDLTKTTINSDLILYAWWGNAQSVDITFNGNGGYFDDNPQTTSKTVPTTYGQTPVAPTPKKVVDGVTSTFKGWDKTLTPAKPESEGGTTTYVAQWTDVTNKCHVTFDGNGGTITSGGDPVDVTYGSKINTAPTVVRDGYGETIGWYDAKSGGNKFTFGVTEVKTDLTLYAHWGDIKTYTVVFNADGGTYSETSSETVTRENVPYNTMPTIPAAPTKVDSTGVKTYTFTGYDKNVVPVTGDDTTITYTAKWSEVTNKCHVTFDGNGGTITSGGDPVDVTYGSKINTAPTVVRDGYGETTGWYDAKSGGNLFTFGVTEVKTDLTLYAHWGDIKTYTVVFNADGGTYSETSSETVTRENVPYNTMPTIPAAPTKVDSTGVKTYTFTGYDKNVVPVTGDDTTITYTAKWSELTNKCHVTFDGNGGTITSGGDPVDVTYGSKINTAPTVVRDGYGETIGWYDAATGGNKFTFGVTEVKTDLTLYAHWGDIKQYTVHFKDIDGGGTISADQTVNYNESAQRPSTPTKQGYTFIDWYTTQEHTEAYQFPRLTGDSTEINVWGYFEEIPTTTYTITFSGTSSKIEGIQPGAKIRSEQAPTVPTKTGYTPIGWCTDEAGTMLFNFDTEIYQNYTLYPGYEKNVTITFMNDGQAYGDPVEIEKGTIIPSSEIPTDPTKQDYSFAGWGSDTGGEHLVNLSTTKFYEDTTLYANWTGSTTTKVNKEEFYAAIEMENIHYLQAFGITEKSASYAELSENATHSVGPEDGTPMEVYQYFDNVNNKYMQDICKNGQWSGEKEIKEDQFGSPSHYGKQLKSELEILGLFQFDKYPYNNEKKCYNATSKIEETTYKCELYFINKQLVKWQMFEDGNLAQKIAFFYNEIIPSDPRNP